MIDCQQEAGRAVAVTVRDARSSEADREWIRSVYPDYLAELSASKTGLFPVLGEWSDRENEFLAGWFADSAAHPFVIMQSGHRVGCRTRRTSAGISADDGRFPHGRILHRQRGATQGRRSQRGDAAVQPLRRQLGSARGRAQSSGAAVLAQHHRAPDGRPFFRDAGGGEVRHRFRTESRPSFSGGT